MPYYEYRCAANGRTLEVRHPMDETVDTWAELCARAGLEVGTTPADTPVERLMSVPVPVTSGGESGGCGPGCACAHPA